MNRRNEDNLAAGSVREPQPTVLMATTVARTAAAFLLPYARCLRRNGWRVELAAHDIAAEPTVEQEFDRLIEMEWRRWIWPPRNSIAGIRHMRRIMFSGEYDVVHVHTPIAAALTRIACVGIEPCRRPKLVYTAHGFHFHRNGGKVLNLLFLATEWLLSRWTDALVVINRDDEVAARRWRLGLNVYRIPGIGIELSKYRADNVDPVACQSLRARWGIPDEAIIVTMIAEFNPGKHHATALRAIAECVKTHNVYAIFAGMGPLLERCKATAEMLGISNRCKFVGFWSDVPALLRASTVSILPSEREGLPRSVLESMACGVPVVGAESRGIRDLLQDGCGILHRVGDFRMLAAGIIRIVESKELSAAIRANAITRVRAYEIGNMPAWHATLYRAMLSGESVAQYRVSEESECVRHSLPVKVMVIGGVSNSLVNFRGKLLGAMKNMGCEVVAVAGAGDPRITNVLALMGVRYIPVEVPRATVLPYSDYAYYRTLVKILNMEMPDLVLAYTHKPIIYSAFAMAHSRIFGRARCYGLITGLGYAFTDGKRPTIHRALSKFAAVWLYRRSATWNEGLMFQNADDLSLFRKHGLVPGKVRTAIVNGSGVDLCHFSRTAPRTSPVVFLTIVRLIEDKGVFEYIKAAKIVATKRKNVVCRMIGVEDTNPTAISRDVAQTLCAEAGVEFFGEVEDVRSMLSECSVFVLASYREGLPRTVLEAMAVGRPIITTDAAGCRDTVECVSSAEGKVAMGRNGALVPCRDAEALAEAMLKFVDEPNLITAMGAESRTYAAEKYDVHRVNEEILRFMGIIGRN